MKRLITLAVLSLFLLVSVNSGVASAHVLKQDNGISGVLHIPPDDNPSAGQPTELGLSFGDDSNSFSLVNCDCQVAVKKDNQVLRSVPLHPALNGATLEAAATVTFPSVDVYDVIVSGTPKDGSFHAFKLDYLVRVASGPNGAVTSSSKDGGGAEVLIVSLASLAIVGIVAYGTIASRGRYSPSLPRGKQTINKARPKTKTRRKHVQKT